MRITSCSLWWTQHLNELLVHFTLIKDQYSIPLYFCIQCFKLSCGFNKIYLYLGCAKVGTSNVFGLPSKSKTNSTLYLKSTISVNKLAHRPHGTLNVTSKIVFDILLLKYPYVDYGWNRTTISLVFPKFNTYTKRIKLSFCLITYHSVNYWKVY